MDKSLFVRHIKDELHWRDHQSLTQVTMQSVFSGKGTVRLYILDGIINQLQHKTILDGRLILHLKEWFHDAPKYIFMRDSVPNHKSKTIMEFMVKQKHYIFAIIRQFCAFKPDLECLVASKAKTINRKHDKKKQFDRSRV